PAAVNLDISDVANPKLIGKLTFSPPFVAVGAPSLHSALPLWDRNLLYVNSEAIAERCNEALNFAGLIDNRNPARPRLMSLFPLPVLSTIDLSTDSIFFRNILFIVFYYRRPLICLQITIFFPEYFIHSSSGTHRVSWRRVSRGTRRAIMRAIGLVSVTLVMTTLRPALGGLFTYIHEQPLHSAGCQSVWILSAEEKELSVRASGALMSVPGHFRRIDLPRMLAACPLSS